jgi:hypothetical protein
MAHPLYIHYKTTYNYKISLLFLCDIKDSQKINVGVVIVHITVYCLYCMHPVVCYYIWYS